MCVRMMFDGDSDGFSLDWIQSLIITIQSKFLLYSYYAFNVQWLFPDHGELKRQIPKISKLSR